MKIILSLIFIISVFDSAAFAKFNCRKEIGRISNGENYYKSNYCSPSCIYYTARSSSYRLTHTQALEAAQTKMNIQVFFTALTPSYKLNFEQALEAAQAEIDAQVFFTVLTPSYKLNYKQALEAAQADINIQTYLHLLVTGFSHETALQKEVSELRAF